MTPRAHCRARALRALAGALAALLIGACPPLARANPSPAPPPARPAAKPAPAPSQIDGLLRLGAKLTNRGDYPTAEIAFWQVLRDPGASLYQTKSALLGLARLHRRQGSLTKAVAIYERYIKEYPDDERLPDALLDLGRTLRDMEVYPMAISCLYSVINSTLKFPSQDFGHYQLLAKTAQFEIAQTYFESGDFASAAKYFSRVRLLELAPADRARAHFMAAFAQQLSGDNQGAVATLHTYLEEWPADKNVPEARYLLATTLRQLKRPQEALAVTFDLLRAEHANSAADPARWAYWQRRTGNQVANEFFQNGDALDALAIYQGLAALSSNPEWRLPDTYQTALCHERLGQLDLARSDYRQIVAAGNAAAGHAPPAEVSELARMAAWRLAHLEWRDNTDRTFSTLFSPAESPRVTSPRQPPPS